MRFSRTHLVSLLGEAPAPAAARRGGGRWRHVRERRFDRLDAVLLVAFLALTGWNWMAGATEVGAVSVGQAARKVVGARATTSWFDTVTADHQGTSVSLLGGSAAGRITPSATNAGAEFYADSALVGAYVYKIRFESTALGDDIPAGSLTANWTVGGAQRTASLVVDAAAVSAANRGGFTAVVPGSLLEAPKSIRVVYRQS